MLISQSLNWELHTRKLHEMNREEILIKSVWESAKMKVYVPFFEKEVEVWLTADLKSLRHITGDILSATMVDAVNDLLNLDKKYLPLMKKLIYKHCLDCCEATSYGFEVMPGESEKEANLREFEVKNETEAFLQANLYRAYIEDDELEKRNNRYVRLSFYPEWENEHGLELILKNGELLDHCGEGDTWLTQFES